MTRPKKTEEAMIATKKLCIAMNWVTSLTQKKRELHPTHGAWQDTWTMTVNGIERRALIVMEDAKLWC